MEGNAQFEEASWEEIYKGKNVKVVVSKEKLEEILREAGQDIDEDGHIVDAKTGEKVLANDYREIKIDDLGAVAAGSKIFIRKNWASFSDYLATKR